MEIKRKICSILLIIKIDKLTAEYKIYYITHIEIKKFQLQLVGLIWASKRDIGKGEE